MRPATRHELEELLSVRPGAVLAWAGVLESAKFTLRDAETFLETAALDATSPLRKSINDELGADLDAVKEDYGVPRDDGRTVKYDVTLRYLASTSEQDVILRETAHYSKVRFKPATTASFTAHVVARSVRQINSSYLTKAIPRGSRVLEPGADTRTLPYRDIDFSKYKAAVPRLGPRDVVRHSGVLPYDRILSAKPGVYPDVVRSRAKYIVDNVDNVLLKTKVEDVTWRADTIVTNDASHDIPFDNMPRVMSNVGATVWLGAMMRVKGLSRHTKSKRGEIPVLGARYEVMTGKDSINFHFGWDPSFDYTHKLSEHMKYEERMDYTFRCGTASYIYTKLPATTDSTLFFCVYRVAGVPYSLTEPTYVASDLAGKVLIRSLKSSGEGIDGVTCKFRPCEFELDQGVYERVLERRQALGIMGNISTTISYMRSVRVRFVVNGVSIGVEHRQSQQYMESAAVAIEVLAGENRRAMETSLQMIDQGREVSYKRVASSSWLAAIVSDLFERRHLLGTVCRSLSDAWQGMRSGLVAASLDQLSQFCVEVIVCPHYLPVSGDVQSLELDVKYDGTAECVCRERNEVHVALSTSDLTSADRRALEVYSEHLSTRVCTVCEQVDQIIERQGEDVFFDASETAVSGDSEDSSCVSPLCEFVDDVESVTSYADSEPVDTGTNDWTVSAMHEYADLQRFVAVATRSSTKRDAIDLFRFGHPTKDSLSKFCSSRVESYVVEIKNTEIISVWGGAKPIDLSMVYDQDTDRFLNVIKRKNAKVCVPALTSGLYYSSSALRIFNQDALAASTDYVLNTPGLGVTLNKATFVSGVPGCGKTYEIKCLMKKQKANKSILYLSATVASAEEVRDDVYGDELDGLSRVRTLDSFLLHPGVKADVVYVDEAPMAHVGQLVAALSLAAASEVRFYGDFRQIPFCSFSADFGPLKYATLEGRLPVKHNGVSHRVPAQIAFMWRDKYPKFTICDCHKRDVVSHSMFRINSASEIPYRKDARYLVFTQKEKIELHQAIGMEASVDVLKKQKNVGLSTVHEDQGGTHDVTILVRLVSRYDLKESKYAPSIYNKEDYVLTATTRHKREFAYYTTSTEDDVVCQRLTKISHFVENQND